MKTKKIKWKNTIGNNIILKADWGYISYNPQTGISPLGRSFTDLLTLFGRDVKDGEETALYVEEDDNFRILTGDFRKEYERVFPNKEKCLKVYNKFKKEYRNNYSTD